MDTPSDFIGRGIAFPMGVDASGSIALVGGTDDIDRSLRAIVLTAPGERVMRPTFGCRIWDLVFAPLDETTLGLMSHAVREAVAQWEPRVELQDVRVTPADQGVVHIDISYQVRVTNDRRNLVFPFYVIPDHDEGSRLP